MSAKQRPSSELVERVLEGNDPVLQRLAAEGLLPIPPDELIPLQVKLAASSDPDLAKAARVSLGELPIHRMVDVVRTGTSPEVLRWLVNERRETDLVEAILQRRDVPRDLLASMAAGLPAKLQELLLVRQDAIVEHPEILDFLETNPDLSSYARRRIAEYREHLVRTEEPEEELVEGEPTEAEVAAAIEEARELELPADKKGPVEVEASTGLSEAQIRTLPIPVRRKLSRTTRSKSLRGVLIRDPNPQVALTALGSAALSDGDVEKLAASRSVVGEVLEEIGRRRDWITKYKVLIALVHNPRTPAGLAVRLIPRVSVRELGMLAKDHNVPHAVRSTAQRLYRMKRR